MRPFINLNQLLQLLIKLLTYNLTGIGVCLDGLLALDAEQLNCLADVLYHSRAAGKKLPCMNIYKQKKSIAQYRYQ